MRNYKRNSNLLKVTMLLVVALTFFACPQNSKNDKPTPTPTPTPTPNQNSGLSDIVGSENANETLKGTSWVCMENKGNPGQQKICELKFDAKTNLCEIKSSLYTNASYVGEYNIQGDKVNLKLDKSIEVIKNYTAEGMLKDMKNTFFDEEIKDLEEMLKTPGIPEDLKKATQELINAMKKAINDGMFDSPEKFKKLMSELVLPAQVKHLETTISSTPSMPEDAKKEIQETIDEFKANIKNPELLIERMNAEVASKKMDAERLTSINPIILTLPQGQTLDVATTMTANKVYLGVDSSKLPQYKDSAEFERQ